MVRGVARTAHFLRQWLTQTRLLHTPRRDQSKGVDQRTTFCTFDFLFTLFTL